jgi:hypothetical protein
VEGERAHSNRSKYEPTCKAISAIERARGANPESQMPRF